MKTNILIILLVFCSSWAIAQNEKKSIPISIAYYGQYAIQPGVKIGTSFPLSQTKAEEGWIDHYYLSPQIGMFTFYTVNTNWVLSTDLGYKHFYKNQKLYTAYSVSLGGLYQVNKIGNTVNIGNGVISKIDYNSFLYLLTTANVEAGKMISDKLTAFSKVSVGSKFSTSQDSDLLLFLELGIVYHL